MIGTNGGTTTVYEVKASDGDVTLLGCTSADGVTRYLKALGVPNVDDAETLAQTVISGVYAGFVINRVDEHYGGEGPVAIVYNVQTGQQLYDLGPAQMSAVYYGLGDLVLDSSGDAAIVGDPSYLSGPAEPAIVAASIIAEGNGGGPVSLTLPGTPGQDVDIVSVSPGAVTYTNGGVPGTLTLP